VLSPALFKAGTETVCPDLLTHGVIGCA